MRVRFRGYSSKRRTKVLHRWKDLTGRVVAARLLKASRLHVCGSVQLVVAGLLAAMHRVRRGHVTARLHQRILAPSTMTVAQKAALTVASAVLFALAVMTAFRPFMVSTATFRFSAGLYIPLSVFLA